MFAACRSVEEGIDSISLTPDALLRTTVKVLEIEDRQMIPHGEGTRPRHDRRSQPTSRTMGFQARRFCRPLLVDGLGSPSYMDSG